MPRGMGHRPKMVKISPACVGHNKNLSPLENILLLLFVEKVQRGARLARGLERRRRLKYDYMPHIFMTCATSVKQFDPDEAQHFILPDLSPNCLKSRLRWYMFTSIVPDMGED